jgi:hypothetical protein
MPSLRADTPESVPDRETLEFLLGRRNESTRRTKHIKLISELTLSERLTTGLVQLGKTKKRIEGDPHGTLMSFAGNVSRHVDIGGIVCYFSVCYTIDKMLTIA